MPTLTQAAPHHRERAITELRDMKARGATFVVDLSGGVLARYEDGQTQEVTYRVADAVGWESATGKLPEDALQRMSAVLDA